VCANQNNSFFLAFSITLARNYYSRVGKTGKTSTELAEEEKNFSPNNHRSSFHLRNTFEKMNFSLRAIDGGAVLVLVRSLCSLSLSPSPPLSLPF
jgi:hypothetical protein